MDNIIKFQMSMFGDFKDLVFNSQSSLNPLQFLDFDVFLAGTVQVQETNPLTNVVELESRSRFFSESLSIEVVFLSDRIDFNYYYNEGEEKYDSLDKVYEHLTKLVKRISENFPLLEGNRLALNCYMIMSELEETELQKTLESIYAPPEILRESYLDDWAVRTNCFIPLSVTETLAEDCNCIVELRKVRHNIKVEDTRMLVFLDINTFPSKSVFRFQLKDILTFSPNALGKMKHLMEDIERRFA